MREQGVRGILVYCADYRCSTGSIAERVPDTRIIQGSGKARNNPSDSTHARESRTVCQSQHTTPSATMLACDCRNWRGAFSPPLTWARREWRALLRSVSPADMG